MMQATSGCTRTDLAADLDAIAVGKPHVEHGHLRDGSAGSAPSASSAVPASPTTSMSSSASRSSRSPRRTTSWSSSRKTRIGSELVVTAAAYRAVSG